MLLINILPLTFVMASCCLGLGGAVLIEEPRSGCVLEMPVYDPSGNRLSFHVTRVVVRSGNTTTELLGKKVDGISTNASGDRIMFSSDRIVGKRAIEVTLQGPGRTRLTSDVFVTSCRQRHSLVSGESDLGLDVAFVPIRGRLSGCKYAGDWWVRSVTMFGGQERTTVEDGYVAEDGTFTVQVSPNGVRRILIIGKGSIPVKSIGVDVAVSKSVNIGSLDLTGGCPP